MHASYPDFILKDKRDRIHIFEVKSVNISNEMNIDTQTYENKINNLKKCYQQTSLLLENHIFYLPIQKREKWNIYKYEKGEENIISEEEFKKSFATE